MKVLIFSSGRTGWKATLRSIASFCGFVSASPATKNNVVSIDSDLPALNRAMLTIRMALNPNESVAAAGPRIKSEAARFSAFRSNPVPIGRIVLNVKSFNQTGCSSQEQYRLSDPDEGRASVWYRFKRSSDLALEFIAFDSQEQRLFALVRTYTNWLGKKEFKLGNARTFYLNMVEAAENGYVNVWAGFTSACDVSFMREVPPMTEVSAPHAEKVVAAAAAVSSGGSTGSPFFNKRRVRKLAPYFAGMGLLIASIGAQLFGVTTNATVKEPVLPERASARSIDVKSTNQSWASQLANVSENDLMLNFRDANKVVSLEKRLVQRLAEIRDFRVSVKKDSCSREGRCLKLLSGFQRNLKSRFDRINFPLPTPDPSVAYTKPAELIVSYQQTNTGRELIHLAFCDHEGNLWDVERGLDHQPDGDIEFVDLYSAQFSKDVLMSVMRAKDQVMSETEVATTPKYESIAVGK